MKKTLINLLKKTCLIAALLCSGSFAQNANAQEFRALWVDAWGAGFLNASQVTTLVNHCRTYNFNAVVVQMRRRGDAFYMPQAPNGDPRTTVIASGYDALQELINQCNTGTPKIEVHCWAVTQLIWSGTTAPSQSGHVYNLHPGYLTRNSTGATLIGEGYYLDPGHPDAAMWNYNMAKDVVSRYNINGFHWDYIRYPQQNSGYNPTAIARYNAEFGLTGQPSASNTQFSNWRRRQITDFLRWSSADLLAIKPNLVISTSVFASRSDAFTHRLQDWAAWNNEGILDICMPMNYTADNSTFNSRVTDAFNNQGVRRVYMGQGAYLNTKENTVVQMNYVRNKPLLGGQLYSYRIPNSGTVTQTTTLNYIKNNFQPTWQNTPTLPWKTNPTKGVVKGTVTRQDTGAAVYNATITINTSPSRTQKTTVHGKYALFELPTGSYTVTASATGLNNATGNILVEAGTIKTVNLVMSSGGGGGGTDVIVDNPAATVSGSWSTATSATDKYGADYRFKSQGTGSAYLQFTPNLSSAGDYQVFEWHSQGSNRSGGAPHVVSYNGPTTTVNVNQKVNGGQWNLLGTFNMLAGTGNYVRITDGFSDGGQVAIADAIRFVKVPPVIIMDNPSASIVGSWTLATSATDKFGSDYRYKGQGTGSAYLQYTPNIQTAGSYAVYEWHSQGSNRTTGAPIVVNYSGGSQTVSLNQQINGGQWNLVGTYNFATGTSGNIRITDNFSTGSVVIADAIRMVFVSP
ncbi:MAG: family 10 glycosylhydrolase [Verrucomicrobia bacterium]|nr:family 10 glycosylhydrolase [Verrucomicrobiota bacterium]